MSPSTDRYRPEVGCTPVDEDEAFAPAENKDSDKTEPGHGTRAEVVVPNGHVLAESHASGFTRETPLPGWSMAKRMTSTIDGTLSDASRLDRDSPIGLEK